MSSSTSSSDRSPAPLAVALAVCGGLTLGWHSIEDRLPEDVRSPVEEVGTVLWPAGEGGPYHAMGELESAEVVVVGSSRVRNGIFLDELAEGGLDNVGCLWGGSAQAGELLAEIRLRVPPGRLLVNLDPLTVYTPRSAEQTELLRLKPELGGDADLAELQRWTREVTAFLLEAGHRSDVVESFVEEWYAKQVLAWEQQLWTPRNVDRWLGQWAADLRGEFVRPIETRTWRVSWFPTIDERKSDGEYSAWVLPHTEALRRQRLEELREQLREMLDEGWEIACVRFPVSPSIRALEEAALPASELHALCDELGLPYFDHAADADLKTFDGTHLTHSGGAAFSRRLARELVRELGW